MKFLFNRVLVGILLVTMASAAAFGKTRTTTAQFLADTTVNGTIVKKGTYKFAINEETGELSIFNGNKLIAKSPVRVEQRDGKARDTIVRTVSKGMSYELVSVTFEGSNQDLVLGQGAMQAAGK